MGTTRMPFKKTYPAQGAMKTILAVVGIFATLIVGYAVIRSGSGGAGTADQAEDLVIPKSEISETVTFYPYKAGKTRIEVLAVKASDGTIRTAFNTCQVCFDSGRGYYKQEGNELVCQNCGNRFPLDQVEKVRGGCNPVPILKENKTEDEMTIVISKDFLEQYKTIFDNWR